MASTASRQADSKINLAFEKKSGCENPYLSPDALTKVKIRPRHFALLEGIPLGGCIPPPYRPTSARAASMCVCAKTQAQLFKRACFPAKLAATILNQYRYKMAYCKTARVLPADSDSSMEKASSSAEEKSSGEQRYTEVV
ncbi:hypothetical protein CBL_12915 [Carabus blaptoides fortunei]